jgi:transposase
MPSSHRRYAGWTIEKIRDDAQRIKPATAALCERILESRPHPEQGFRARLGIVPQRSRHQLSFRKKVFEGWRVFAFGVKNAR